MFTINTPLPKDLHEIATRPVANNSTFHPPRFIVPSYINSHVATNLPNQPPSYDLSLPPISRTMVAATQDQTKVLRYAPNQIISTPVVTLEVPYQWLRTVSNGRVTYTSPTGHILENLQDVQLYLMSDKTCKCGLSCPVNIRDVFNFNPLVKVSSKVSPPRPNQLMCGSNHTSENHYQLTLDLSPTSCFVKRQMQESVKSFQNAYVAQLELVRRTTTVPNVTCYEGDCSEQSTISSTTPMTSNSYGITDNSLVTQFPVLNNSNATPPGCSEDQKPQRGRKRTLAVKPRIRKNPPTVAALLRQFAQQ